jgi:hypothetical protein
MDRKECEMTDDLLRETDRFWDDPKKIMNLIDLLFLWDDPDKKQVCSESKLRGIILNSPSLIINNRKKLIRICLFL